MKKKGFTLVELLATIIVLSVIALIATPMVLGVIEEAKKGALENSALGLIQSAKMYYANEISKGKDLLQDVVFDFKGGSQTSEQKLSYKGEVYNGKLILTESSDIVMCIDDGKYYAFKEKETGEITTGVGTCSYEDDKFIIQSDIEKCEKDCELAKKELQSQIEDLTDLVNKLKAIIDERDKTILDMQSTIDGLNNEILTLKIEKEILQDALNDANQNIDELMRRIAELEGQIASLNSTITGLQNQINTLEGEKAELEALLSAKTEELQAINEQLGKVTATASDVLLGKTIYRKDKGLVTGTIPTLPMDSYSSADVGHTNATGIHYGASSNNDSTKYLYLGIPKNTYTGNSLWIRSSESDVASKIGLTASKIAKGQTVLGVAGTFTSDANATAAQILSGKIAYVNGNRVTGSMSNYSNTHIWVNTDNGTFYDNINYTYGSGTTTNEMVAFKSKYSGYFDTNTRFIFGEKNSIASLIRSGKSFLGIAGTFTSDANATAAQILSGKTAYVNGSKITGNIQTMQTASGTGDNFNATNIAYGPNSTNDSGTYLYLGIPSNQYTGSNKWVRTSASTLASTLGITANKIAKGQSISGVTGTYTSDANATAANILSGKTAYVNGSKITGTMANLSSNTTITHSSSNGTKVILGDQAFLSTNSDGVNRLQIRYANDAGFITSNTLFALPYNTVTSTIGLTSAKLAKGQTVLGVTGTYTSDANATAANILSGKTAYVNGSKITGTMSNNTNNTGTTGLAWAHNSSNSYEQLGTQLRIAITPGYYGSNTYSSWGTSGIVFTDYQTKLGITANKIAKGQSISGINGTYTSDATATSTDILSGKTAYVNGSKITGSISSKAAQTYTPGTSNQTIAAGQYLSGAQTIAGDADLIASNIKSGVNIFGVTGTMTSGATGIKKTSGDSSGAALPYRDDLHWSYTISGKTVTVKVTWDGGSRTMSFKAQ